ncbi:GTP-binding protein HflX [Eubacterium nodatum ATCC 33099]|nr:GTP-binding protein HflX [Eubacterium nodatum ATCC 33099]
MLRFTEDNQVIEEEKHRAILVGFTRSEDIEYSMAELSGLAEADNIQVIGEMIQILPKPNSATLIGSGKVLELAEMVKRMEADMVVFNNELTGMQLRNLEETLDVKVIDRTILILDIFASRADSAEGKLQVELAQLRYRMPRLLGFGRSLSRLGAGIGTRGPGEKKLETDRRHIEKRIEDIKADLRKVQSTRMIQRAKREKSDIPVVALVGYTNSGKSAIMNNILSLAEKEDKAVREKDMLFATLDAQQRNIKLGSNQEFILVDTVGFISKLPHGLVEAFKATLEEVKFADLLLHVVDSSYEDNQFQIDVTNQVLEEIGVADKNKLLVFNKIDIVREYDSSPSEYKKIFISAKTGEGVEELLEEVRRRIFDDTTVKFLIPYDRGDISSYLCEKTNVISMDYKDNGTEIVVEISRSDYQRLREFEVI